MSRPTLWYQHLYQLQQRCYGHYGRNFLSHTNNIACKYMLHHVLDAADINRCGDSLNTISTLTYPWDKFSLYKKLHIIYQHIFCLIRKFFPSGRFLHMDKKSNFYITETKSKSLYKRTKFLKQQGKIERRHIRLHNDRISNNHARLCYWSAG